MKHVDRELLREVRTITKHDGTREQFKPIRLKLEECRKAFSAPEVMYKFDVMLRIMGWNEVDSSIYDLVYESDGTAA